MKRKMMNIFFVMLLFISVFSQGITATTPVLNELKFTVLDEQGQRLDGANVKLTNLGEGTSVEEQTINGEVTFITTLGTYGVYISKQGFITETERITIDENSPTPMTKRIILAKEGDLIYDITKFTAYVINEKGERLDGARVVIRTPNEIVDTKRTINGEAVFNLVQDTYRVEITKPNYMNEAIRLVIDQNTPNQISERIMLRSEQESTNTANLRLSVVDERQMNIEGAIVFVYDRAGKALDRGTTNENGDVRFSNLPTGLVIVEVNKAGYETNMKRFFLESNELLTEQVILKKQETTHTARLQVNVRDERQNTIEDATVFVYDVNDKGLARGTTNEQGSIRFSDLPEGRIRIEVIKSGYETFIQRTTLLPNEIKTENVILRTKEQDTYVMANIGERITLPIRNTAIYRDEKVRITYERFFENTCEETDEVSETVLCIFDNTDKEETCYSDQGHRCSGIGSCSLTVKGNKGDIITWKSSCGGIQRTRLNGESERIRFDCQTTPIQEEVRQEVTCVFENSNTIQICHSDQGHRCSGLGSCSILVRGTKNEIITWQSSCEGAQRTKLNGEHQKIAFECVQTSSRREQIIETTTQQGRPEVIEAPGDRREKEILSVPEDFALSKRQENCINGAGFQVEFLNENGETETTRIVIEEGNSVKIDKYVLSVMRLGETQSLIQLAIEQELEPFEEDLYGCPGGCREVPEGCLCSRINVNLIRDYYEVFTNEGQTINAQALRIMPGDSRVIAITEQDEVEVPGRNMIDEGINLRATRDGIDRNIRIFVDEDDLKTTIHDGNEKAETRLAITGDKEGISAEVNKLQKAINVLPEQASEIARQTINTNIERINLKEKNNDLVYEIEGNTKVRVLGIIPVTANTNTNINAETAETNTKKPWYWGISTK